jgi:hypothetical protein
MLISLSADCILNVAIVISSTYSYIFPTRNVISRGEKLVKYHFCIMFGMRRITNNGCKKCFDDWAPPHPDKISRYTLGRG